MCLVKTDEVFPHQVSFTISEGLLVPNSKTRLGMPWVKCLASGCQIASSVRLQFGAEFGVYDTAFSLYKPGVEKRGDKKLGEPLQCTPKILGLNIKIVIGVVRHRVSVITATVQLDKGLILPSFRIPLCTQEQHMLKQMSKTRPFFRITATAHPNIERRGRLVRMGVGY